MKTSFVLASALIVAAALLFGCAEQPYYASRPSAASGDGVVDRIEVIRKGDSENIAGTVIGGIVGGLIGHQIGGGSGQTAATIVGAAGGAVAGHEVERRARRANETFRVPVRMDSGVYQTVTEENLTDLRPGDRIRVDNGRLYCL